MKPSNLRPLIPAWLDRLKLRPTAYRVLCHLWRRASHPANTCYPSARLIASECRINRDTVWPILTELERLELVIRKRANRRTNLYQLIIPGSVGGIHGPDPSSDLAESKGHLLAESKGHQGSPSEGTTIRGGRSTPSNVWPDSLSAEQVGAIIADNADIKPRELACAYPEIRDRFNAHRLQFAPAMYCEVRDKVRLARKSSGTTGSYHGDSTSTVQRVESLAAPDGWSEKCACIDELKTWSGRTWEGISIHYQRDIIRRIEGDAAP